MSPTFLQMFLLVNVFLIGILTAIGVRHAYAHFKPRTQDPKPVTPAVHLPPALKEQMVQEASKHFQTVLDHSATELQQDLKATAVELTKRLEQLGSAVISSETDRYRALLEELRKQTEAAIKNTEADINGHQEDLKTKLGERQAALEAKMNADVAAEKQHLLEQIDTKLGDAAASFLLETLQHEVDLGAQSAYLMAKLEEHKEEFKREIAQ